MLSLSSRFKSLLHITLFFACFCIVSLTAQTIDKLYLGRWSNYTQGSAAKPDSNYTIADTIIEMTYLPNGTYTMNGYIKTDIFTPGKGHLKFKKSFRYAEGRYEIQGNQLELITVKPADPSLNTFYAFESSTNKFKQVNPYDRLWDTRNLYEYAPVENFKNSELFYSRKRQHMILFTASPAGIIQDSIAFWSNSPQCAHESHWPQPVLIKQGIPLRTDTMGGFDDKVDDLNNAFTFDNTNRLVRYYYTSKKDGAYYYEITYSDPLNINDTNIKMIADSKDGSHYLFIRNEKNCLLKIERYDKENRLMETYYAR